MLRQLEGESKGLVIVGSGVEHSGARARLDFVAAVHADHLACDSGRFLGGKQHGHRPKLFRLKDVNSSQERIYACNSVSPVSTRRSLAP
jgi:hypothetical protein